METYIKIYLSLKKFSGESNKELFFPSPQEGHYCPADAFLGPEETLDVRGFTVLLCLGTSLGICTLSSIDPPWLGPGKAWPNLIESCTSDAFSI